LNHSHGPSLSSFQIIFELHVSEHYQCQQGGSTVSMAALGHCERDSPHPELGLRSS